MTMNGPIDLLSVAARRREEAATAVHYALMMQRSPAAAETLAQAQLALMLAERDLDRVYQLVIET